MPSPYETLEILLMKVVGNGIEAVVVGTVTVIEMGDSVDVVLGEGLVLKLDTNFEVSDVDGEGEVDAAVEFDVLNVDEGVAEMVR